MNQSILTSPSFPLELVLEVIEQLPFEEFPLNNLSLVHPRFHAVIKDYETSIVKRIASRDLPNALADFPPHAEHEPISFMWLTNCARRYDITDELMRILGHPHASFGIPGHNKGMVMCGLFLIWSIQTRKSYEAKLGFIRSLKRDPLVAIYAAEQHCVYAARYCSSGLISRDTYPALMDGDQYQQRLGVEFAFGEALLNFGPEYVLDSIKGDDSYQDKLLLITHDDIYNEWDDLPERHTALQTQGPLRRGAPPTLMVTLAKCLAETIECPLEEVAARVKEDIEWDDHLLAWISWRETGRLLKGLNVEDVEESA